MSDSFDPYRVWLGVPPESRPPTHYELLGISPNEREQAVIEAAVLRQSGYVRNFQIGKYAKDAARILNEIAAAKACLLDPAKRAKYDAELKAPQPVAPKPAVSFLAAPVPPVIDLDQLAAPAAAQLPIASASRGRQRRLVSSSKGKPAVTWQLAVAVAAVVVLAVTMFFGMFRQPSDRTSEEPSAANGHVPYDSDAVGATPVGPIATASEPVAVAGTVVSTAATPPKAPGDDHPQAPAGTPPTPAVSADQSEAAKRLEREQARVDLLKLIDLDRDRISGDWRMENGKLLFVKGYGAPATLKIPYRPAGGYVLRVTARRAGFGGPEDYGGFHIPIVHRAERLDMYLSTGWKGSRIVELEPEGDAVDFLPTDKPMTITCAVTNEGFVVSNEAGTKIERRGIYGKATWSPKEVPAGWLFLSSLGNYEFSELTVFPLGAATDLFDGEKTVLDSAAAKGNLLLSQAVAWYRAEGNADDSAGKHHSKLVDGAAITPTKVGHAFDFDGKSGSVVVGDSPNLNPAKQFTVMAWVKPRAFKESGIVSKISNRAGNVGYQFGLRADGSAFVQFNAPGEPWPANSLAAKLRNPAHIWTHIAGSYDGENLLLYQNGEVIGSKQVGSKSVGASPANFRVSDDDNQAVPFDGLVDDAALFGRALSKAEIETIYLGTLEGRIDGIPDGAESATVPEPNAADGREFADLTRKLNNLRSWTARGAPWSVEDSGIRGKGNSEIKFNEKLPVEFTLMFRMRVLAGIRPRIFFDDQQFWFGNEGWQHKLFVHGTGQQGASGAPHPYREGSAHRIACRVKGPQVEFFVDGESVARCQRKNVGPLTLELSAGDGFSAGDIVFDGFRLESADFVVPSLPHAQRSLVERYSNASSIDVLALVEPARDAKSGKWTIDFQGLHSPADTYCAALRLPVVVPNEYCLTIVAERAKGWKGTAPILNVGHVCAGKQFNSTSDWNETAGFELIDGKHAFENESTAQCGQLFEDGRVSVVTYIVRRTGVEMLFDGRQILNWQGDYRRFSLQDEWRNAINSPLRLFLGTHCDWQFRAIRLTPLTDGKTPPADAQLPPKDLLKTIDLPKHARGGWAFDGSVLVSPANVTHAGVRFPGAVPDEYRLRIVAERPRGFQGSPQLHLGLVTQSSQATLVLDADHKSGLEAVGGKMYHENATTFQGDLFIDGVESTIDCMVGKEGIRVDFDGHTIIDWHGDLKQLTPTWTQFGAPRRTFWIGTHCNYRIKRVEILPVTSGRD